MSTYQLVGDMIGNGLWLVVIESRHTVVDLLLGPDMVLQSASVIARAHFLVELGLGLRIEALDCDAPHITTRHLGEHILRVLDQQRMRLVTGFEMDVVRAGRVCISLGHSHRHHVVGVHTQGCAHHAVVTGGVANGVSMGTQHSGFPNNGSHSCD
jgi:hypothetical protein